MTPAGARVPRERPELPVTLDGVDARWLTHALAPRVPGVAVVDVARDHVTHGTATRARLTPTYGPGPRGPATLWMKAGFEEHSPYLVATGTYANEVHFYRELRDALAVPVPACWYAGIDVDAGLFVVLLEDLVAAGATFGTATRPLPPHRTADALGLLARVHARWWEHGGLDDLPWLGSSARGGVAEHYRRRDASALGRALDAERARHVPEGVRDAERLVRAFRAVLDVGTGAPSCLLHGDAHLGNLWFAADGTPGLLDWQGVKRGRWAYDVAQLLAGSLAVDDRRRHERELLDGYLDALRARGVAAPGRDEAWHDYRRHLVSPLVGWLCTSGYQPEEVCTANVERFATAVDDLDALSACDG